MYDWLELIVDSFSFENEVDASASPDKRGPSDVFSCGGFCITNLFNNMPNGTICRQARSFSQRFEPCSIFCEVINFLIVPG
jgi:hypothetical protein